jgi:hypothetical protein
MAADAASAAVALHGWLIFMAGGSYHSF